MLELLKQFDLEIFFQINGHHTPFWDAVMYPMTRMECWFPLLAIVLFFLFRHYHRKTWGILLCLCLSILCTDRSSVAIKQAVQRSRPTHQTEIRDRVHVHVYADGREYRGGPYSFPSSHAANSFGIVVLLIAFFRKITRHAWWIFPLWALVFCYTRIYLGVHYPSDIFCGAVLGVLCGSFVLCLYHWVEKFSQKRIKN